MRIRTSIAALAVTILAFFPAGLLLAQTPPPTGQKLSFTTVATVNIQDVQVAQKDPKSLTVGFKISNREGVQPAIVYAVELFQKDRSGNLVLADQKVYSNDVLSLGTNALVDKKITYDVPAFLKGPFVVQVEARSPDGLIFGQTQAMDEAVFGGTGEYIRTDPAQCFVTVEDDKANTHYTAIQGVDVSSGENLTVHCSLMNLSKTSQTITPVLETHYRSIFGKLVGTDKQSPVNLSGLQKMDFSAVLQKPTDPQAYDAVLTFVNGNGQTFSSPVIFHYVIQGESATLQNITLDKDSYSSGDTAQVSFFWTGPVTGFLGARSGDAGSAQETVANFTITDGQNNSCADTTSQKLNGPQGGLAHIAIPITRDCKDPIVTASLSDASGKVLANNTYKIASREKSGQGNTMLFAVAYLIIFLILAVLIIVWVKKHRKVGMVVLFGFVMSAGMLTGASSAKADTGIIEYQNPNFSNNSHNVMITVSYGMDKTSYPINSTMTTYMKGVSAVCVNGDTIDLKYSGGVVLPTDPNQHDMLVAASTGVTGYSNASTGSTAGKFTATFSIVPYVTINGTLYTAFGSATIDYWVYVPAACGTTPATCVNSNLWGDAAQTACGQTHTWLCGNADSSINCSKVNPACPIVNGTCGSNSKTFAASENDYPTGGTFCSSGTANPAVPSWPSKGSQTTWVCKSSQGGSDSGTCTAVHSAPTATGVCGSNHTSSPYSFTATGWPSSNSSAFCSTGSATPASPSWPSAGNSVSWWCKGDPNDSNTWELCDALHTGAASSINGQCSATPPLCTGGTSANDNNATACNTTRSWQCLGSGGGTTATCTKANAACSSCDVVNGICATAAPFCKSGVSSNDGGQTACGTTHTWRCDGVGGGSNSSCTYTNVCSSATCGSAVNAPKPTKPASNLCSDGSTPPVILSGNTWVWMCGIPPTYVLCGTPKNAVNVKEF